MRKLIGGGVFNWDREERYSDRYGAIELMEAPFGGARVAEVAFEHEALASLQGRRVRLVAQVLQSRESSHPGDPAYGLKPTRPAESEEVDLGVGRLRLAGPAGSRPIILLEPEDGRQVFWIDPRKLYRLHDQTVALFAEETQEPCSPRPEFEAEDRPSAYHVGGGGLMFKKVRGGVPVQVLPHMKELGDGCFLMEALPDPADGVRLDVRPAETPKPTGK